MTAKKWIVLAAALAVCVGGAMWAVRQQCFDKVVSTFQADSHTVTVWRSANFFERDHLYYVVTTGETQDGPFYIGPMFSSSPDLDIAHIGESVYCVYNRDEPDDVYCYFDFGSQLYYPSPDQSQNTDVINRRLAAHYRASAALTNIIATK